MYQQQTARQRVCHPRGREAGLAVVHAMASEGAGPGPVGPGPESSLWQQTAVRPAVLCGGRASNAGRDACQRAADCQRCVEKSGTANLKRWQEAMRHFDGKVTRITGATGAREQGSKENMQIRFMVPCAVQCDRCGEIIPPHRKFNGHKDLLGEKYLDTVKIYTLTFHCPQCHAQLVLQTDPANADYITKAGCHRLFQKRKQQEEEDEAKKEATPPLDKTSELESRLETLQNQQLQIDELTRLQQLQSQLHKKELHHNELNDGNGTTNNNNNHDDDDDLQNSTFENLKKQFETKSSIENLNKQSNNNNHTKGLIKLRPTNSKDKKSKNISLGVVIKKKKNKKHIIGKISKK